MTFCNFATALATAGLVLSPFASAEDARITCTGTVASVLNGGVGAAPFANVSVGETVVLTVDIEIARQLPFGDYVYLINHPSSELAVGTATDGLQYSPANAISLRNDFGQLGDIFGLNAVLAGDPSTVLQFALVDPTGLALDTEDLRDLYGTTLLLNRFVTSFRISNSVGSVEFALSSVQVDPAPGGPLGTSYCTAAPNSTGAIGITSAFGLQTPGDNDLSLIASGLPTQTFGYFLTSLDQDFVVGAGGSVGNLCLGGAIGRFVGPGQVTATDFGGEIALPVDLTELPTPTGLVVVQSGQTWNFQLWHRDTSAAGPTSNFTTSLEVTFQ